MEDALGATTTATERICTIEDHLLLFYRSIVLPHVDECAGSAPVLDPSTSAPSTLPAAPPRAASLAVQTAQKRRIGSRRKRIDVSSWKPHKDVVKYHQKGKSDLTRRNKFVVWCALQGLDPLDVISGRVAID